MFLSLISNMVYVKNLFLHLYKYVVPNVASFLDALSSYEQHNVVIFSFQLWAFK